MPLIDVDWTGEPRGAGPGGGDADHASSVLLGLAKDIASTLDRDQVLERVLEALSFVVPATSSSLFLLDGRSLELRASRGIDSEEFRSGFRLDLERYPLDKFIVESGSPLLYADVQTDPRWASDEPVSCSRGIRAWMGLPIAASGQVIGLLTVDSELPGAFSPGDLELARSFADLAAVAVRNARLFADARRRLASLEAVNRIGRAVAAHLDVNELCEVVGENLAGTFRAGAIFVAVWDEDAGLIRLPYSSLGGKRVSLEPQAFGQGLLSWIIERREPLDIETELPRRIAELGGLLRAERLPLSLLGVPILSGKRAMGALSVQSFESECAFSEEDLRLLGTMAASVGAGIRNARLYQEARRAAEEARRRADETAALAEAGREISESLDPDIVLGRIAEGAMRLLSRDSAAVYLLEEDRSLRAVVAVGNGADELRGFVVPPGAGIVGGVVASGTGVIVNDVKVEAMAVRVPGTAPDVPGEKLLAAPLIASGAVTGVMAVWRGADEQAFTGEDLDFLGGLARQAAVAIENARLHRRVADTASRMEALYDVASAARAEAEEAARVKSRFLANMTHELRTPLNAIINMAFLIQAEGEASPASAALAERIEGSGRHLLGLINDALDMSKIEAGRMEVILEDVDLGEAVRAALAAAGGLPRAPGLELRDEVARGLPPARADRTRLRQVLLNLLSNALKFTDSGFIAVRAREEGGELLVEVADTGIGMDPARLHEAFAEFVQLDADLDRRRGGTGLGLSLSRRFVELQGGRLWADTRPGAGSTFRFTLPVARIAAGEGGGA